jgi:hypothetical protein
LQQVLLRMTWGPTAVVPLSLMMELEGGAKVKNQPRQRQQQT